MMLQLNPTLRKYNSKAGGKSTCIVCGVSFILKKNTSGKLCSKLCADRNNAIRNYENAVASIGKIFNGIEILEIIFDYKSKVKKSTNKACFCIAKCHCGKIFRTLFSNIKYGLTKSCRCSIINRLKEKNPRQLPAGESRLNIIYCSYRRSAEKRGYDFSLTKEDVRQLTKSPCYYCGRIEQNCGLKPTGIIGSRLYGEYKYNGIDRVKNDVGYIIDNCVPCCGDCNMAKSSLSKEHFFELIKMIYAKHFCNDISVA